MTAFNGVGIWAATIMATLTYFKVAGMQFTWFDKLILAIFVFMAGLNIADEYVRRISHD